MKLYFAILVSYLKSRRRIFFKKWKLHCVKTTNLILIWSGQGVIIMLNFPFFGAQFKNDVLITSSRIEYGRKSQILKFVQFRVWEKCEFCIQSIFGEILQNFDVWNNLILKLTHITFPVWQFDFDWCWCLTSAQWSQKREKNNKSRNSSFTNFPIQNIYYSLQKVTRIFGIFFFPNVRPCFIGWF